MTIRFRGANAFTLLEIMIVITIIGVLAAMAVPNIKKSIETAQAKACITNLRNIDAAKVSWMATANKTSTDTPAADELFGEDKFIRDTPKCPAGGSYDLRAAGQRTLCGVPGHSY